MSTNLSFTDTHIHVDQLIEQGYDPLKLLQSAVALGIERLIVPDVHFNLSRNQQLMALSKSCRPRILCAWGCHPGYLDEPWQDYSAGVAVGECGLQRSMPHLQVRQVDLFMRQLQQAKQQNLPLIIHSIRRDNEVLKILQDEQFCGGGIIHNFVGDRQIARRWLNLGFVLGIGSHLIRAGFTCRCAEALRYVGQEYLVFETDAPYRGNRPEDLIVNAQSCATLLNCSLEDLSRLSETNVKRIFRID